MKNFFKVNRFWTFEQAGSRHDQMNKYLGQVQSEMFKQAIHRNIVGTIVSFPIHYFFNPTMSAILLLGVGVVQYHSIYKHRQSTKVLGYYKDQKHLLNKEFSHFQNNHNINNVQTQINDKNVQSNNNINNSDEVQLKDSNNFTNTSQEQFTNYAKYLQNQKRAVQEDIQPKQQQQSNEQSDRDHIRYIQIENTEERMKYYNRQLFCMGLLQGIFLGSYEDIWVEDLIYLTQISFFINTFLNTKIFQKLYESNYNMTHLKAMLFGTFPPLPLITIAPVIFNNGFIQSNLLKEAQQLFLSENINQDPSHFLIHRTGFRLLGLLLAYFLTYAVVLGDLEEDDENQEDDKKVGKQKWIISFNFSDDDNNK